MAKQQAAVPLIQLVDKKKTRSLRGTLEQVFAILEDRRHWVREKFYWGGEGWGGECDRETATRACLIGACQVVDGKWEDAAKVALRETLQARPGHEDDWVESFNDNRRTRHADVLRLVRETIDGLPKRRKRVTG